MLIKAELRTISFVNKQREQENERREEKDLDRIAYKMKYDLQKRRTNQAFFLLFFIYNQNHNDLNFKLLNKMKKRSNLEYDDSHWEQRIIFK